MVAIPEVTENGKVKGSILEVSANDFKRRCRHGRRLIS